MTNHRAVETAGKNDTYHGLPGHWLRDLKPRTKTLVLHDVKH